VLFYGHTDAQPGMNNVWLSKMRASAVRDFMKPLLPGKKVVIGWFAATKPLVPGTSSSANAKNRRVEIWVK
jgi:flagellar motor protein MotB